MKSIFNALSRSYETLQTTNIKVKKQSQEDYKTPTPLLDNDTSKEKKGTKTEFDTQTYPEMYVPNSVVTNDNDTSGSTKIEDNDSSNGPSTLMQETSYQRTTLIHSEECMSELPNQLIEDKSGYLPRSGTDSGYIIENDMPSPQIRKYLTTTDHDQHSKITTSSQSDCNSLTSPGSTSNSLPNIMSATQSPTEMIMDIQQAFLLSSKSASEDSLYHRSDSLSKFLLPKHVENAQREPYIAFPPEMFTVTGNQSGNRNHDSISTPTGLQLDSNTHTKNVTSKLQRNTFAPQSSDNTNKTITNSRNTSEDGEQSSFIHGLNTAARIITNNDHATTPKPVLNFTSYVNLNFTPSLCGNEDLNEKHDPLQCVYFQVPQEATGELRATQTYHSQS